MFLTYKTKIKKTPKAVLILKLILNNLRKGMTPVYCLC